MTYRQLADHVKQRQRLRLQKMTRPGDDWYPEVYYVRPQGVDEVPIDPAYFRDRATKHQLVNGVMVPAIRTGRVRMVALTVVMYALRDTHPMMQVIEERKAAGDPAPGRGLPYFQDVEGSIEMLWIHVFDAERYEGWTAQIKRPAKGRPELAPFELNAVNEEMSGELTDPIKAALR